MPALVAGSTSFAAIKTMLVVCRARLLGLRLQLEIQQIVIFITPAV
jgi:hypothetical protein